MNGNPRKKATLSAGVVVTPCMDLHDKVLVAGFYTDGFYEKLREDSPLSDQPVPAGSKTDLLLAKAKPTGDSGSASVITYSRRGRKKLW